MSADDSGLIVACFGNRGLLDIGSGEARNYILKGKRLRAVCGDHVSWTEGADDTLLVTGVEDRSNALERIDTRGLPEIIAANLTRLVIVMACEPAPDWFIADRYLCAGELLRAESVLVWNKQDLAGEAPPELDDYRSLGYPVITTAALAGDGVDELISLLGDGVSMLVGQSGVGKSSLINGLVPAANVATSEVSAANREGKHTTTASVMHLLPNGGRLIDSPGVRDFAPAIRDPAAVQAGFREIIDLAAGCRFANCQHLREPNCAVKQALEVGDMSARRYESYKRLINTVDALASREYR